MTAGLGRGGIVRMSTFILGLFILVVTIIDLGHAPWRRCSSVPVGLLLGLHVVDEIAQGEADVVGVVPPGGPEALGDDGPARDVEGVI